MYFIWSINNVEEFNKTPQHSSTENNKTYNIRQPVGSNTMEKTFKKHADVCTYIHTKQIYNILHPKIMQQKVINTYYFPALETFHPIII